MTIFNYFRKRYFSFLLSLLVLHISCNPSHEQDSLIEEPLTIEQYVDNHVSLTFDLIEIFEGEDSIDFTKLETEKQIQSFEELKIVLKEANVGAYESVIEVLRKIDFNNNNYLAANPNSNTSDINDMIEGKLDKNTGVFLKNPTCESQRGDAGNGCAINAGVSFAVATVSAFFTLGIGTVVGYTTAVLSTAACVGRANLQYDCCKGWRTSGC
ncbi:MAG: hypothetical protein ABJN84_00145 [Flavobacteriaceae bacterium]